MICPSCKSENDTAVDVCFTCGRALAALTLGSIIGRRFEVREVLGRGGMGTVYKAHDRMLEVPAAIKVLRSEFVQTEEMGKRFRSEINLARRVTHRNVCRIHDYGEEGDLRYISMEFVEGTDIKQVIRDKGGLSAEEAFDSAIQVAEGLQAIHDVGIIHRDLKTPNIMRDSKGLIKLMDFGIAKEEGHSGGMTTTGQVMGTPEYMSPEQCRGEKIDFRADIYALGIVSYELFTGQVPFRGDTPVATLFKHIQEAVPLEGTGAAARIPPPLVPVLRKALAKEKAERYATAAEMAVALKQAKAHAAVYAPPPVSTPPPVERRKNNRLDIYWNFIIRRVGTMGGVLQAEQTIAENISRGGARVFTTMFLNTGDVIEIEEDVKQSRDTSKTPPFKTRAEVMNTYVGRDNTRRLNLKFLDGEAPDRLVSTDDARPLTPRPQAVGHRRG